MLVHQRVNDMYVVAIIKIVLLCLETSLPTPMTARVYVNLPEGISHYIPIISHYITIKSPLNHH